MFNLRLIIFPLIFSNSFPVYNKLSNPKSFLTLQKDQFNSITLHSRHDFGLKFSISTKLDNTKIINENSVVNSFLNVTTITRYISNLDVSNLLQLAEVLPLFMKGSTKSNDINYQTPYKSSVRSNDVATSTLLNIINTQSFHSLLDNESTQDIILKLYHIYLQKRITLNQSLYTGSWQPTAAGKNARYNSMGRDYFNIFSWSDVYCRIDEVLI